MNSIAVRLLEGGPQPALELLDANGRWVPFDDADDPTGLGGRISNGVPAAAKAVVVIGLGLGHVLDAIEQRAPETHVIALEPTRDLAVAAATQERVKNRIARGRLTVSWGPEYETLGTVRTLLGQADSLPIIINPVLARVHSAEVADARTRFRQRVFEARANEDARRANAGRYLLNTLRNLSAIASEGDVAALTGLFEHLPAVVIAAGPSLDRSIAELREV